MQTQLFKFERPEALYLLLIIPLFVLGFLIAEYLKKRSLKRFASPQLLMILMPLHSSSRKWIKFILIMLAYAALVVGIANPQTGSKIEEVKREGIDLFIALDISNSMMAEDILPNRLERSKQSISRLIDKLTGDRVGMIVFAGKAYIQLPLTTDYAAAKMFLSTINPNIVAAQGTAIGEAIQIAANTFDVPDRSKAIIVISDGEDHEANAVAAAQEAAAKGIEVFTIGMGLAEGAPIPVYNQYGKQTGFRKDRNNITIITRLNESLMQQIAGAGNGIYVRANNARTGLESIFEEINSIAKSEIDAKVFTDYENKFWIFIALALVLLFAEVLIANRKSQWETRINLFDRNKNMP